MNIVIALIFVAALFCSYRVVGELIFTFMFKEDTQTSYLAFATSILWGLFYYLTL